MSHTVVSCPPGEIRNGDAFAVQLLGDAVKRRGEYASDDESSPCKYRKMTTEEKILDAQSGNTVGSSYASVSDDSFDGYSNDDRDLASNISNDEENSGDESNACKEKKLNGRDSQGMTIAEYRRMMNIESDSDAPSDEVSAQEEFTKNGSLSMNQGKSDVSQDNVITNVVRVNGANPKTESGQEIAENESEPDNSTASTDIPNGMQHPDDPNAISNTQIALVGTQPFQDEGNADFIMKQSDSMKVHAANGSEVVVQETNSGQVYGEQLDTSHSYSVEHPYPIPSTSGATGEPITDASRVESVSGLDLVNLVLGLRQDIQTLVQRLDKQESILATVVAANEMSLTPLFAPEFNEKYGLKLPLSKLEDFEKFNQELMKSTRFCNEFITNLCSYIDNKVTLAKNILTMVRKYMSKDLATLFNASKPTNTKMVLKDTMFCKCLLQATKLTIRNGLLPLEHEKAFMKNLGLVISGARGWPSPDENQNQSQNLSQNQSQSHSQNQSQG